jgi:carbonic anhydrase/acetyltransferase-like protein (isoleucine patch superfamily)
MGEFFALIRGDTRAFVVDNRCDALAGVWVHEFHEFTRIVAGGVIWDLKWGNFLH